MIDTGAGTAENYPIFSVAGGRARNQNFTLDGGNVSNAVGLTRPQQLTSLPVDAMQEFKVIANNYSAEYGHSTGGIVTMATRSGPTSITAAFLNRCRTTPSTPATSFRPRSPVRLNQYGGTFGGPIRKGQDALLRDLGADAPIDQLRHHVHGSDAAEPAGRFFGPAQHRGQSRSRSTIRPRDRRQPRGSRSPAT